MSARRPRNAADVKQLMKKLEDLREQLSVQLKNPNLNYDREFSRQKRDGIIKQIDQLYTQLSQVTHHKTASKNIPNDQGKIIILTEDSVETTSNGVQTVDDNSYYAEIEVPPQPGQPENAA